MTTSSPQGLAFALAGIPVVADATSRNALFPNPAVGQRVDNLGTGAIEMWNGTSWVQRYLAGNISSGTPAVLVNDEALIALPTALDFLGRFLGAVDGTVAKITVPDLPIKNPDGSPLVASPMSLQLRGTGVSAAVDDDGNVVFTITAGGGMIIEENGTPIGPASTLNVAGAGFTLAVAGAVATLTLLGAARSVVSFTTAALNTGDVATGTIDTGALAALLFATCNHAVWLRIYGTAADRTADNARALGDLPTTPIALELQFVPGGGSIRIFDPYLGGPVFGANRDNPAANVLYWSLTMLEQTLGPFNLTAEDDVSSSPPGSDVNLSAHAPTTPMSSGWTAWEYKSGSAARYIIWGTFGGILCSTGATDEFSVARTNVDFAQEKLRMTSDVFRLGVDGSIDASLHCLLIPDEAIGGYDNTRYLMSGYVRESGTTVTGIIQWIDAGGMVHVLASAPSVPLNISTSLRMITEIIEDLTTGDKVVSLYSAVAGTGASKTLLCSATAPTAIAANTRIGVRAQRAISSTGILMDSLTIEQGDLVAETATVNLTRTQLERVGA